MIRIPINRLLATAMMAGMLVLYIQHDYAKWGQRGREAFLTYQAGRFDRYMATSHMGLVSIVASVMIAGVVFLLYELLATAFSKLIPASKTADDKGRV